MSDFGFQTYIFSSGDSTSVGTNATWSQQLPGGVFFNGVWEACLISASHQTSTVADRTHFIEVSWLVASAVGSQLKKILFRSKPLPASSFEYYVVESSLAPWREIEVKSASNVRCQIYDSTGAPIPVGAPSTVEIVCQQVATK